MSNRTITQAYLHEILEYDPETGVLKNRINRGRRGKAGHVHNSLNTGGYRVVCIDGTQYKTSRVIWFMMTGAWPRLKIDHEDRDRTNERWTNLRQATQGQNMGNRSVGKNSTTGIKGVCKRGKRFSAQIRIGGKLTHLGYYPTETEAAEAYREAAEIVFEEFAHAP